MNLWGQVRTPRGLFLASRTGGDPLLPVCPFKTCPCVCSKRPRVYRHHAHTLLNMCACCRHTRGRFECTHGGVLSLHTGFSACHTTTNTDTHQHTPTPQQHTTQHNTHKQPTPSTHTHTHTKHTPRPPTTSRPHRHTPHNTTHNITRRER